MPSIYTAIHLHRLACGNETIRPAGEQRRRIYSAPAYRPGSICAARQQAPTLAARLWAWVSGKKLK